MSSEELNIQPKASILGVFSRLNYKPWYAIGEFVDNSTASFFGHKKSLKFYQFKKLIINVDYDAYKNTLTITDNAYGMEKADFERAVLMDQKPDNLNGRNEFGMGLKTAASWFGNVRSVESTQLGSETKYFAEINIPKLKEYNLNSINIIKTPCSKMEHGTKILISQITKKIDAPSTKRKIKDLLSSMYRRDINSGDVDIYFNGEKLSFEPFTVLKFRNNERKKYVDFTFEFNGDPYHVTGFVGIMQDGSFAKAGLALFRYNRVIIGGFEENYKPKEIFEQVQSQISLKLFGELNMEDFPVNQAKDGFVWNDGLEDVFLENLKKEISDYIKIASLSKKDRAKEEEINDRISDEVNNEVKTVFEDITLDDGENVSNTESNESYSDSNKDNVEKYKQEQVVINSSFPEKVSKERKYPVKLDPITTKEYTVIWKIAGSDKWFDYVYETGEITININHPFFKPFSADLEFKKVLESFVVSFVCAEELAKKASAEKTGSETMILPSVFRNKMNLILRKIGEKNK